MRNATLIRSNKWTMILNAEVHGTIIQLQTDDEKFLQYSKINLFHYLVTCRPESSNIFASFSKHEYEKFLADDSNRKDFRTYYD